MDDKIWKSEDGNFVVEVALIKSSLWEHMFWGKIFLVSLVDEWCVCVFLNMLHMFTYVTYIC